MSHLGRPEKATPEERKNLTMDKVAARFGELLGKPVKKAADEVVGPSVAVRGPGDEAGRRAPAGEPAVRPARAEERPRVSPSAIAALGDAYVNDAFGTCHNDKDASHGRGARRARRRPGSRARSGCSSPRNWRSSTG